MAPSVQKSPRKGKTFEQRFLDELTRQCAAGDTAVNNAALRQALNWQDKTFSNVRTALIRKGIIRAAPGHGGKTRFANPDHRSRKAKAFISYSHADEALKDIFIRHLSPLKHLGLIESWHDREIKPGERFDQRIEDELKNSDIVFLLISIDFINSEYCYGKELTTAINLYDEGKAKIIPIILRPCFWKKTPFGQHLALPKDGHAVTAHSNIDEAFSQISEALFSLLGPAKRTEGK